MDTSKLAGAIYDYLGSTLKPIDAVLSDEKQVEMDGLISGASQEIAEMAVKAVEAILNQGDGGRVGL